MVSTRMRGGRRRSQSLSTIEEKRGVSTLLLYRKTTSPLRREKILGQPREKTHCLLSVGSERGERPGMEGGGSPGRVFLKKVYLPEGKRRQATLPPTTTTQKKKKKKKKSKEKFKNRGRKKKPIMSAFVKKKKIIWAAPNTGKGLPWEERGANQVLPWSEPFSE